MMADGLWSARPDLGPWCARLAERIRRWQPDPLLAVDRRAIAAETERAAAAAEAWLAHPCLNALTREAADNRYERDVRFVTWVAAHAGAPVGSMTVARPSWRWSPDGKAMRLPAGRYDLAGFAAGDTAACGARDRFAIDVHCRSTGFPLPRSWPEPPGDAGEVPPLAAMAVREIAHALDALVQRLPECAAWASAVTRVIVPLRHEGRERSSGSQPELPGLIHLAGLHGPVAALEALVHESAHHHFTLLEAAGAFVDPDYRGLHPSPLRSDPRPLGRVLLAVHALWHMAAFYDEGQACDLFGSEWSDRGRHLERQLEAGCVTLQEAWPHLTAAGRTLAEPWLSVRVR
jgi:HEXXH motif-containing protein